MDDQQIQLALHCTQLVEDKLFMLRMGSHPHSIIGAGFLMALVHGRPYVTNAEIVEYLRTAYQTIIAVVGNIRSDAPGCTGYDFTPLPPDKFDTMVLQVCDLIRAIKFVPATSNFLVFEDAYRSY